MSRDKELDDLERELRGDPYLYAPDDVEVRDGMACWLDEGRVCGPICVAYNTEETDENGVAYSAADRCLVLLTAKQQGAAIQLAAAASTRVSQRRLQERAEAALREAVSVKPPDPYGKGKP